MKEDSPLELIYSEVSGRLKDQFDSVSSLDTKAGIILGFISVFLAGLTTSSWFISLPFYFLLPFLIAILLSFFFALIAILARKYRKDPEPDAIPNFV